MDKQLEIEAKYQKLASEYSKVRSQATVLKKAVLDEQAKSSQLNDVIKSYEQTIRKRDQEMESLTFRNEQLTKRISVLQQELQTNSHNKKGKQKSTDVSQSPDLTILDEELQKKILENARLLSSISDKDLEIAIYQEKIGCLEEKIIAMGKDLSNYQEKDKWQIQKLQKENETLNSQLKELKERCTESNSEEKINFWKTEAEKWKVECELLKNKPNSNENLSSYYESQLSELLNAKAMAVSETKSLLAENKALKSRLEHFILEHTEVQNKLEKSYEELVTTNENYKSQLDALTEHLAAQNEKITHQCDEIQLLKHKLSMKK